MVLSEFAGAAQSLNGSIIVNPWNTEEMAQAIQDALTMSDELRAQNHYKLYKYVTRYTSQYWGDPLIDKVDLRKNVRDGIEANCREVF